MNINIRRKLITILLSSISGLCLVSCGTKEHEKIYTSTLTDICLEENSESNVDEVMSIESNIKIGIPDEIYGTEKIVEEDLIESLDILELYTKRLIKLKEAAITLEEEKGLFDFFKKDVEPEELSDEKKQDLISMSLEELEELLEKYTQSKQKDIERARTEQELKFLFNNDQRWLQENGGHLLESGMIRILKANICYVSGLEPENYKDCTISEYNRFNKYDVTVMDKKTGKSFRYKITEDSGIYYEMLNYLYGIQFGGNYTVSTYELAKALNIMKECAVTSPTINDDRIIVPTITKEEAIQKVKKHQK